MELFGILVLANVAKAGKVLLLVSRLLLGGIFWFSSTATSETYDITVEQGKKGPMLVVVVVVGSVEPLLDMSPAPGDSTPLVELAWLGVAEKLENRKAALQPTASIVASHYVIGADFEWKAR